MVHAYAVNLFLHALGGLLALAALAIPLVSKKGSKLHKKSGWVWVAGMVLAAVTGLLLALSWMMIPLQVKPPPAELSPEQVERWADQFRTMGVFFGFLAIIMGSAVWQGLSAIRLKKTPPAEWATPFDHIAAWAPAIGGGLLLVLGLFEGNALYIAFGALGLIGGWGDIRFARNPPDLKGVWLLRHLQAMLGGATASVTAFSVLVLRRFMPFAADYQLAFWLVPVALGSTAATLWTRAYQRRLGYRG